MFRDLGRGCVLARLCIFTEKTTHSHTDTHTHTQVKWRKAEHLDNRFRSWNHGPSHAHTHTHQWNSYSENIYIYLNLHRSLSNNFSICISINRNVWSTIDCFKSIMKICYSFWFSFHLHRYVIREWNIITTIFYLILTLIQISCRIEKNY